MFHYKKFQDYLPILTWKGFSLKLTFTAWKSCFIHCSETWTMMGNEVNLERSQASMFSWMCGLNWTAKIRYWLLKWQVCVCGVCISFLPFLYTHCWLTEFDKTCIVLVKNCAKLCRFHHGKFFSHILCIITSSLTDNKQPCNPSQYILVGVWDTAEASSGQCLNGSCEPLAAVSCCSCCCLDSSCFFLLCRCFVCFASSSRTWSAAPWPPVSCCCCCCRDWSSSILHNMIKNSEVILSFVIRHQHTIRCWNVPIKFCRKYFLFNSTVCHVYIAVITCAAFSASILLTGYQKKTSGL